MKKAAAIAERWTGLIVISALASALAGCGGGYGGGSENPAPVASLTANPTTITFGQSATLTWSSSQGTDCLAGGAWDGMEPATGMAEVTPTASGAITYTLTCTGGGYSRGSTGSVTLTVVPASAYTTTSLVEDFAGGPAVTTDAQLVNPWGIAFGPTTAVGVANNHGETMTLYDGNGQKSTLIADFASAADAVPFEPTGIVFNDGAVDGSGSAGDFLLTGVDAVHTAPAAFILAGEAGKIAGWSPVVDFNPVATYAAQDGASYKGLALAKNGDSNFLYATDFANGKIDVFDASFSRQAPMPTRFAFADPTLPEDYAPFGIQAIGDHAGGPIRIYVTYAKRGGDEPGDDAPGPGLGIVDVFDTNGELLKHLVAEGGKLNAPWGMALAPPDFGTLGNALLIGNFGDGAINGYDPSTGRYLGAVTDTAGTPFSVPGLRGIAFGNDALNQPHATLFFAADTNDEMNGLYGRIDLGADAPALGPSPFVTLTAPEGDLSGTVSLKADVGNAFAVTVVRFFLNGSTLIGSATSAPFTLEWDTTAVANGDATLPAVATEENGIVGSSNLLPVSVMNPAAAIATDAPKT